MWSVNIAEANAKSPVLDSKGVVEFVEMSGEMYIFRAYGQLPTRQVTFAWYGVNMKEETITRLYGVTNDWTINFDETQW